MVDRETTVMRPKMDYDEIAYRTSFFRAYSIVVLLVLSAAGITIALTVIIGLSVRCFPYVLFASIIGLLISVCRYYGTNNSIVNRIRYRPTKAQRAKITRRLSGP